MRWEAVKKTVLWTVFRPTVRARKREDVDFRVAEIVSPAGPTMIVNAPIRGVFHVRFWCMDSNRRTDRALTFCVGALSINPVVIPLVSAIRAFEVMANLTVGKLLVPIGLFLVPAFRALFRSAGTAIDVAACDGC